MLDNCTTIDNDCAEPVMCQSCHGIPEKLIECELCQELFCAKCVVIKGSSTPICKDCLKSDEIVDMMAYHIEHLTKG